MTVLERILTEKMLESKVEDRTEYSYEVARKAITQGLPIEVIETITGLDRDEILKLMA